MKILILKAQNITFYSFRALNSPPSVKPWHRCSQSKAGTLDIKRSMPEGEAMLILAHRPFEGLHTYAETGPVFLCAKPCTRGGGSDELSEILTNSADYRLKGYSPDECIVYETGEVVTTKEIHRTVARIFENPEMAFIQARSARNSYYQARL